MLLLGKNPLICDCDNLWLIRLLRYRNINQAQRIQSPKFEDIYPSCTEFKNVSMAHVTESHLACYSPKIQNVTIKLISKCRAQIVCHFSKKVGVILWYVGNEQVTNQTFYNTMKLSDKSFSLFVDNIAKLNGSVKCQVKGKSTVGEVFVSNTKCTKDYDVDDLNTVTISKFWFYVWIAMALAVIICGIITIALFINLCHERQPTLQRHETSGENVIERANHFELPLPPIPMLTIPRNDDISNQSIFYDYPLHREFY